MSLIKCPECTNNISDKAETCPSCGIPINNILERIPVTVSCLDCKTEFDLYAEVCPKCGLFNSQKYKYIVPAEPELETFCNVTSVKPITKEKPSKVGIITTFIFISLAVGLVSNGFNSKTHTSIKDNSKSGSPASQLIAGPDKVHSAQEVIANVRQLANVVEEGDHLVVEFKEYLFPYDINKRLQFVRAIADADCIITGKPRLIFFYNPDKRQIAQADTINGVSLTD